jgi:lysophospholipase L1-like esterase
MPRRARTRLAALATATLAAVATVATVALVALPATPAQAAATSPTYYVSLGDSYSVGYQPVPGGATPGYATYVAAHTHLTLVNFGCAGATSTTLLHTVGCPVVLPHTAGGQTYPTTTQAAAALAFIAAHRGHIGLITVTIGGNDVVPCATKPNTTACVLAATGDISTNVTSLAAQLRAAAGARVPIIGSTYPDVLLGAYVWPTHPASATATKLAALSVTVFKSVINPTLAKSYANSAGSFVDVTRASGAYTPLTRTVPTRAYGSIPVPVAAVCSLTWFCARGDIHSRNAGYTLIGKLIVARYHAMTHG